LAPIPCFQAPFHERTAGFGVHQVEERADTEDTIVPRLLEHGADLRRIHFLEGFTRADADACANDAGPSGTGAHLLLTPGGLPLLDRALRRLPEVKLVVFDSVSAFLDGNGTRARHVLSAPLPAIAAAPSLRPEPVQTPLQRTRPR